jgi:VanZ family protein
VQLRAVAGLEAARAPAWRRWLRLACSGKTLNPSDCDGLFASRAGEFPHSRYMPPSDSALGARLGDRHDDLRVAVRGGVKPPVLSRRAIRGLCLVSLLIIVYGTLGPLHAAGPWIVPVEHWHLVPPYVPSDLNDLFTNFVVYVPVGVAFRLLVRRRGRAGGRDLALGFALSLALSYTTEVLQQALPGRVPSATDVYVNALGALVGALCAVPAQGALRRIHGFFFVQSRAPQWRAVMLVTAAIAAIALLVTMPAWEGASRRAGTAEPWMPFQAQFQAPFSIMLALVLRQLAAYALLTLVCLLVAPRAGPAIALLLLAGLVGTTECWRMLVGRPADTTSALLAVFAWVLTTRTWRSLAVQPSKPTAV